MGGEIMILNVSGRTDIVAYYTPWFINRIKAGFFDVRNPFYPKQVSRIFYRDVDAIVVCTKNPIPIIPHLPEIQKPCVFHITITPYKKEIEPHVPPKGKVIEAIKQISNIIGERFVYIRYDPIFLNSTYTVDYHVRAFRYLCELLDGYTTHIIISFLDHYKNVDKNKDILDEHPLTEKDYEFIGSNFSAIAKEHHMTVQTCAEHRNLKEYGFIVDDCISKNLAYLLTKKTNFKEWKARNKMCHCVEMVDIGAYNSCFHKCKYCYANYSEEKIESNMKQHDPNSSLLIGTLSDEDQIKTRK